MHRRSFFYLSVISLIFSIGSKPAQCVPPDYFILQSVKIRQVSGPPLDQADLLDDDAPLPITLPSPGADGGGILSNVDVVGVGRAIWTIIDANQPVLNADINHYSALPPNTTPDQLGSWSDPKKAEFEMVYTNKLGLDVVKFRYMILFQFGGAFRGAGKYVANASVIPTHIAVDWGYKFDVQVQNFPPTNLGTDQNPVAMIQMALKWTVSSEISKEEDGASYDLDGNGRILHN